MQIKFNSSAQMDIKDSQMIRTAHHLYDGNINIWISQAHFWHRITTTTMMTLDVQRWRGKSSRLFDVSVKIQCRVVGIIFTIGLLKFQRPRCSVVDTPYTKCVCLSASGQPFTICILLSIQDWCLLRLYFAYHYQAGLVPLWEAKKKGVKWWNGQFVYDILLFRVHGCDGHQIRETWDLPGV